MPVKVMVPAREIVGLKRNPLMLDLDQRCSRCDRSPAEYYEVHRLFLRVGIKKNRLVGNKFEKAKSYRLKIGICETCYESDFLTHPEALDHNGSWLGRIAQFHSIAWTLGALFAAAGFLLLTPIIPARGVLLLLKNVWQLPVAVGVIVLFLTWLSQRKYQSKVLRELEKSNPDFRPSPRSEVRTPILESENDLTTPALEIKIENEPWAIEISKRHGWTCEKMKIPEHTTPKPEE
jgi:membrane protein implicated in regulation of membrane protease activity